MKKKPMQKGLRLTFDRKYKLKPQGDTATHSLEWLKFKHLTIQMLVRVGNSWSSCVLLVGT